MRPCILTIVAAVSMEGESMNCSKPSCASFGQGDLTDKCLHYLESCKVCTRRACDPFLLYFCARSNGVRPEEFFCFWSAPQRKSDFNTSGLFFSTATCKG